MVVWLALRLVPRELYLIVVFALLLQLAGVDVIGYLVDLVLDPAVAWLESQLRDQITLW